MSLYKFFLDKLISNIQRIEDLSCKVEKASELVDSVSSVVIIGVGKSGYVGRKFAASLQSISVQACFIHAGEAGHGDLGFVTPGALVFALSKSGNSSEINLLLPILRSRNCTIVAITNRVDSELANMSDLVFPLKTEDEGDNLNILPLISTEISLVICDCIVAYVAELKGYSEKSFAVNHPCGQLGFNISYLLKDLSTWKTRKPFLSAEANMFECLLKISEHKAGILCVVDSESRIIGIVSDGDIRRAITERLDFSAISVGGLMNQNPLLLKKDFTVGEALEAMERQNRKVFAAPVVNQDGFCEGVVTLHDLLRV
ncbi:MULTISPECIES: SIS domain-containing protein [unclassified Dolichospermum]|uniref:SIS domain-containing protein n=1 Tax=unclassified Dolichospermum TaxID=2622029 RepID=UPI001446BB7E|nr:MULTISPECIES: SIS domain-containing protein [unclassified Dolichospermum]MTJ16846.1 SIS domain-containing protein [Dolichospermum sp. UHCC 0299]MTJ41003.1 SIS domain-containing protein [Dolichospermum sp. UHCC 0406]